MKTIVEMVHGSHLYGLNTEDSDMDYKGIYLPDGDSILLGDYNGEIRSSTGGEHQKNTKDDVDRVTFSLSKFLKRACDGETIAIDMLHCDQPISSSSTWDFIRENRSKFYTKNMKAFLGYCKKQAAKYGIKGSRLAAIEQTINYLEKRKGLYLSDGLVVMGLEGLKISNSEHIKILNGFYKGNKWIDKNVLELCGSKYDMNCSVDYTLEEVKKKYNAYGDRAKKAKSNNGLDWKALSHALRAAYQLREIYLTGDLKYPLVDSKFLLEVKKGEHDYGSVVAPELERVIEEVEELAMNSNYPEKVNHKFWEDFLLEQHYNAVIQSTGT